MILEHLVQSSTGLLGYHRGRARCVCFPLTRHSFDYSTCTQVKQKKFSGISPYRVYVLEEGIDALRHHLSLATARLMFSLVW